MIEIRNAHGFIMHKSKNLRGLLAHTRRCEVERVILETVGDSPFGMAGRSRVEFRGGDHCTVEWASASVMAEWFAERPKKFPNVVNQGDQE